MPNYTYFYQTCLQLISQYPRDNFQVFKAYLDSLPRELSIKQYTFLQECFTTACRNPRQLHFAAYTMRFLLKYVSYPSFSINPYHYYAVQKYLASPQALDLLKSSSLGLSCGNDLNQIILEYANLPTQYFRDLNNNPLSFQIPPSKFDISKFFSALFPDFSLDFYNIFRPLWRLSRSTVPLLTERHMRYALQKVFTAGGIFDQVAKDLDKDFIADQLPQSTIRLIRSYLGFEGHTKKKMKELHDLRQRLEAGTPSMISSLPLESMAFALERLSERCMQFFPESGLSKEFFSLCFELARLLDANPQSPAFQLLDKQNLALTLQKVFKQGGIFDEASLEIIRFEIENGIVRRLSASSKQALRTCLGLWDNPSENMYKLTAFRQYLNRLNVASFLLDEPAVSTSSSQVSSTPAASMSPGFFNGSPLSSDSQPRKRRLLESSQEDCVQRMPKSLALGSRYSNFFHARPGHSLDTHLPMQESPLIPPTLSYFQPIPEFDFAALATIPQYPRSEGFQNSQYTEDKLDSEFLANESQENTALQSPALLSYQLLEEKQSFFLKQCQQIAALITDKTNSLEFELRYQEIGELIRDEKSHLEFLIGCQSTALLLKDEKLRLGFIEQFQKFYVDLNTEKKKSQAILDLRAKEKKQREDYTYCVQKIAQLLGDDKAVLTESLLFKHLTYDLEEHPKSYTLHLGKRFADVLLKAFSLVNSPEVNEEFSKLFRGSSEVDPIFRAALDHCPIDWMKAAPAVFELCMKGEYKAAAVSWLGANKPSLFLAFRNHCFCARLPNHQRVFEQIWANNPNKHMSLLRGLERTALSAWQEDLYPSTTMKYVSYFSIAPLHTRLPRAQYVNAVCALLEACFTLKFAKLEDKPEAAFRGLWHEGVGPAKTLTNMAIEDKAWTALSSVYAQKTMKFLHAREPIIADIIKKELAKNKDGECKDCETLGRTKTI